MLSKELMATEKALPIPWEEHKFGKTFEENFMRKEPEILPNLKPLNIAEAPKTAVSAVLKASLGEDKYLIYL